MNNQHYLDKLHIEIVSIMDEIDRVCRKFNLRYYLVGGTLLGAVRHQGFIPWDDDLDIAMPREDMMKFIEIAPQVLSRKFELEWHTTKPYYHYFPKVSIRGTLFYQDYIKDKYQSGIFVDIFPLDLSPAYDASFDNLKKNVRRVSRLRTDKSLSHKKMSEWCISAIGRFFPNRLVENFLKSMLTELKKRGTTHYANFGSQYNIKKQTMPIEWYGGGIDIEFAGRYYKAPTNYKKVLESVFGYDYMKLPPEEKRRCHYPSKVIFSDGEIMTFGIPQHVVTVEEQEN